ncbi:aquaporin [Candidatus Saccharibacteria bacterium]|nr:aquaporin [Candidatus Saccharibacteria bacterium]
MATTKSKKTAKKTASKSKAPVSTASVDTKATIVSAATDESPMKGFFSRKSDPNENILTIFKTPRIYGAILGEVIGTMLLTMILLLLGVYQPMYIMFGVIAITGAIYGLSGANLNPIITVGMMASRRISAIRGVLYILAQVLGAWFAYLLSSAFINTAGDNAAAKLPVMAEVPDGKFWVVTMIEFVGAIILGFFFVRALMYKRSTLTFATIYGTGICVALLITIVISSSFLQLQNNFILNPAAALMYQVLPTSGDTFGAVLGSVCLALLTYIIFPMLGGVIGFALGDVSSRLAGEPHCCGKECAKK